MRNVVLHVVLKTPDLHFSHPVGSMIPATDAQRRSAVTSSAMLRPIEEIRGVGVRGHVET